jgi:DnaJ family protein C protein 28
MIPSKKEKPQLKKRLADLPEKLEEYQTPAEEQPQQKQRPTEEQRQMLVERLILEAMAEGKFDNLPGKGQPLKLDENPYLEPGQEIAFGLLKKNGFAPEWIERDKAIRKDMDKARHLLRLAWEQRRGSPANEPKWRAAVARFEESLAKLNQAIDDFNLIVPILSCQRSRLRLADELRRVQQE